MQRQKPTRAAQVLRALMTLRLGTKTELRYKTHWELLVSVILSAQTTDKKVNEVTKRLFKKYRTLDGYARAEPRAFEKDIAEIGLFRSKAKNILAAARMLKEKYNGRIPRTMAHLVELPGVGRKTANVVLGNLFSIAEGVIVDTHVTRMARLLGLTKHKDPKKIETDLMRSLQQKEWWQFGEMLVHYGRHRCPARCTHLACPLRRFIRAPLR